MATPAANSTTVIGPDTHIRGDMSFESSAQILGRFEGTIASKGDIHIGETSICRASVDAQTVVVSGTVEGDLTARQCVQLNSRARVNGDIVAANLVVAEGASFVGHCRVGPDASKLPAPAARPPGAAVHPADSASADPARSPRPVAVKAAPAITISTELEATLAGLENKLANLSSKPRQVAGASE